MNRVTSIVLIALVALVSRAQAQEQPKAEDGQEKAASTFELAGVFESTDAVELVAETKQVTALKIEKIVPHGTEVDEGEAVVWFQTEDIDEQLKDAESKLRLAELTMEETEFDYKQFLETQRLDRQEAERNWQAAKDAYDNYMEFELAYEIESAKFSLESARFQLEYAQEDLRQLERMYKEDELTEESEELVLKRARRDVEATEFRLKSTEFRTERTLEEAIPREREQREATYRRAEMAYEKALLSLDIARQKKDLEYADAKKKLEKQREEFEELKEDRENYVLRAPASGILYHGSVEFGQLSDKRSTLKEGASVSKDQTVATIVPPSRLRVRVDLAERDLAKVQKGAEGTAIPTAFPDVKLSATVEMVGTVPYAKGKFDCVISVELGDTPGILPGMTCKVEFPSKEASQEDADTDADKDEAAEEETSDAEKSSSDAEDKGKTDGDAEEEKEKDADEGETETSEEQASDGADES